MYSITTLVYGCAIECRSVDERVLDRGVKGVEEKAYGEGVEDSVAMRTRFTHGFLAKSEFIDSPERENIENER